MQIGISSFGEIAPAHLAGQDHAAAQRMQELLAMGRLADGVGLDVLALGEHHRPDFIISAPEVILAAVAAVTKNIRLSSAVTVLSSVDPVRTFQNFATVDLISNGRAEIIAGRGSFIESFPLFGQDLKDYDALFIEKLQLLLNINDNEVVTWQGKHRAAIDAKGVYPRPAQAKIPVWIGVGGTPASVIRAGQLGLPLTIAILGGAPAQYVPFAELYRESAQKAGHDAAALPLAINCHLHLADTAEQARDEFFPPYSSLMNRIGRERGWSPMDRRHFDYLCGPQGPLLVGTPQDIIDKLLYQHRLFNNTRFLGQLIIEGISHQSVLRSVELLGAQVAPAVRAALGPDTTRKCYLPGLSRCYFRLLSRCMLNVLWSVLNALLLLGSGYILFRAVKLVRQHMGWGATLLFIAVLLVLSRRAASPSGPAKNLLAKAPMHEPLANASASQTIDLGGTNQLFLRAEYNAHSDTLTPRGLYAGMSGFILGHEWEPRAGMLQPQGSQLHYWALLDHRWLLLGTPVFSSGMEFEGTMKPDRPLAQR